MEKMEYRAVIKFLFLEGQMLKVYSDCSLTFRRIERWVAKFKCGRKSLEDDPYEGRPKSASSPEINAKIH